MSPFFHRAAAAAFLPAVLFLSADRAAAQGRPTTGIGDPSSGEILTIGYLAVSPASGPPERTLPLERAIPTFAILETLPGNGGARDISQATAVPFNIKISHRSGVPPAVFPPTIARTLAVNADRSCLFSPPPHEDLNASLSTAIQITLAGSLGSVDFHPPASPDRLSPVQATWSRTSRSFVVSSPQTFRIVMRAGPKMKNNTNVEVASFTIVPEPAAYLAGAFALGLVGWQMQSRRRARRVVATR